MAGVASWQSGYNPYRLEGAPFSYPPTALPVLWAVSLLGSSSYLVVMLAQVVGWGAVLRREGGHRSLIALLWGPLWMHAILGQITLASALATWLVAKRARRGWGSGLLLALALIKPHVALIPVLWVIWCDRASPERMKLWAGLAVGTILLALPTSLRDPAIWGDWLASFGYYAGNQCTVGAWQGWGLPIVVCAAILWAWSQRGGWAWWATAALVPGTAVYALLVAAPAIRADARSPWTWAGLASSLALLFVPFTVANIEVLLAAQLLTAWAVAGGPPQHQPETNLVLN